MPENNTALTITIAITGGLLSLIQVIGLFVVRDLRDRIARIETILMGHP